MKKIKLVCLLSLFCCSCSEVSTSSIQQNNSIQKLEVNYTNVKDTYFLGEELDLSSLDVVIKEFIDGTWLEKEHVENWTSSIQDGTTLNEEGEIKITISYLEFVPVSFYVLVLNQDKYLSNDDFSKASNEYNASLFGKNTSSPYFDPLSLDNNVLVVPYYFTEQEEMATEENRKKIEDVFFSSENKPYSVKSYYEASSYHKTNFNGDVINWMKSSYQSDKLIQNGGYDAAKDIYEQYQKEYRKDSHGILGKDAKPLSYYDSNNDGAIDLLWIIYSRPMEHTSTNQWWAYTSHEGVGLSLNVNNPVPKTFCWASFSFMNDNYDPHTYVHETGHAYGLVDYYDYNSYWSCMGGVDMMDNNIGDHSGFSKFSLGWTSPLVVNKSSIIKLKKYSSSGEFILLPSQNYNNTPFDEYLTLEYISTDNLNSTDYYTGYNGVSGYKEGGIRISHIDARVKSDNRYIPLDDIQKATNYIADNSYFGRNSSGKASSTTTDFFEGHLNDSNVDRSYYLTGVISASFDETRYNMNSKVYCDDSSLFKKNSEFSLDDGYNVFMPSYSSLWNKARSHVLNNDDYKTVIDESLKCSYYVKVLDINEDEATLLIEVK